MLRAATEAAAEQLGWPEVGELRVGHHADLVIYRGEIADGRLSPEGLATVAKGGVVYVDDGRWVGPNAAQTRRILGDVADEELAVVPSAQACSR